MGEKKEVFSSKVKYIGVANFKDFYKFCFEWLEEETGLGVKETKYIEKVAGDSKEVEFEWEGSRAFTDYFKFNAKIKFRILQLQNVEIQQEGKKIKTNSGNFEIKMTGTLERDYDGKFVSSALKKFMRGVYDKYIIPSMVDQFEDVIATKSSEFLEQAKAYLSLEGRK